MNQKIFIAISIVISMGLVYMASFSGKTSVTGNIQTVVKDGVQTIEILAKGGYSPRRTIARANTPTKLEVKTVGTYDCSLYMVIPAIKYREQLPSSGVTEIDIPPQKAGSKLYGLCGMGMYSFEMIFK